MGTPYRPRTATEWIRIDPKALADLFFALNLQQEKMNNLLDEMFALREQINRDAQHLQKNMKLMSTDQEAIFWSHVKEHTVESFHADK